MNLLKKSIIPLLVLLVSGCVGDMVRMVDEARIVAKVGILADADLSGAGRRQQLRKAFEYFRQEGVDAVAIAGTVTTPDAPDQPNPLQTVWQQTFGGSPVPLFSEPGRHEINGVPFATAVDRPVGKQDVLTFYGTRRLALTDELCVYPRGNRAICAGSMSGVALPRGFKDKELETELAKSAEGLLVSFYSDKTVVRRLDFTQKLPVDPDAAWEVKKSRLVYAEDVAEPWILDADGQVAKLQNEIPEFWPDSRLMVILGYDRSKRIYTVKWPSVLACRTGTRARWYVMEAAFADTPASAFLSRTFLSRNFHQSEDRDGDAVKCVFKASEFPAAQGSHKQVVFRVTPVGPYGKSGKPLVSPPAPLPVR